MKKEHADIHSSFHFVIQHNSALSQFVFHPFLTDQCILWNTVLPVWLLGGKSQDTLPLQGWSLNTIPKFEWGGWMWLILASFPCPSCENKFSRGGSCIPLTISVQEVCIYFWEQLLRPTHARFPRSVWWHLFPRELCIHASWVIFICHVGTPRSTM